MIRERERERERERSNEIQESDQDRTASERRESEKQGFFPPIIGKARQRFKTSQLYSIQFNSRSLLSAESNPLNLIFWHTMAISGISFPLSTSRDTIQVFLIIL